MDLRESIQPYLSRIVVYGMFTSAGISDSISRGDLNMVSIAAMHCGALEFGLQFEKWQDNRMYNRQR